MCGILGFITDTPSEENNKLLCDLLYISSSRGTDATGVAVVGKTTKVTKEDIPADKFLVKYSKDLKKPMSKANVVLGHTRLATQGHQKDNNNNHPIIGQKYIMVHNGTCSSMDRIKDYPYKGTVDSEILLSYVEKEGLVTGLKELKGSAAVAIIKEDEPDTVYLWRHSNPLWVAYDPEKKVIFFGSTEEILREGLSNLLDFFTTFHMRQIAEDVLYKVKCNPLSIEAMESVEPKGWGYHYKGNKNSNYPSSYSRHGINVYGYGCELGDFDCSSVDKDDKKKEDKITPQVSDLPIGKTKEEYYSYGKIYRALQLCKWDPNHKGYTTDPIDGTEMTKYFFTPASYDFEHWRRLEGGGHASIDKKLVKLFDHTRNAHYLMTMADAIREGLVKIG